MRSASLAPIACRNVTVTAALDTGAVHAPCDSSTRSGCGSVNAPFTRWPGSDTLSVASPAVLVTVAPVVAVYSAATPGTNGVNVAGAPKVSDKVAGTVPPTVPGTGVAVLIRSDPLWTHTFPPRPVTRGAVAITNGASAATLTPIVIGGSEAPGASTVMRVQETVAPVVHVHPSPLALVAVSPAGIGCVTTVGLSSDGVSAVGLDTVSVIVPEPPRAKTAGEWDASTRSGWGTSAHGDGGVPGYASGMYGTARVIWGIGCAEPV